MNELPFSMTVVVPVKNGGRLFEHLAAHLAFVGRRYGIEVLIIDSGSTDGTCEVARSHGFRLVEIPPHRFGHGRTRNLGVRLATGELVVMITHDVLPCTPDWPEAFARHFRDPKVAGAYGRQVPRSASTAEMFFVARNYPDHPIRYEPGDGGVHMPRPGRVLLSDAFSVLRRSVALRVPYVNDIPVSEDQVFAHQALERGHAIVYEPDAEALHAHSYTLRGLWKRVYYVGAALRAFDLDHGVSFLESLNFLKDVVGYYLRQGRLHRLPGLLPYEAIRWLGFQAGKYSGWGPASRSHLRHLDLRQVGGRLGVFTRRPAAPGEAVLSLEGATLQDAPGLHTWFAGAGGHRSPSDDIDDFIAHSCEPSCRLDTTSWSIRSLYQLGVGDEITVDYNSTEWKLAEPFVCSCGAEACVGHVSGLQALPDVERRRRAKRLSPALREFVRDD